MRLALRSLGGLAANLTVQIWQWANGLHIAALARNNDGALRFIEPTLASVRRDLLLAAVSGGAFMNLLELENVSFRYPDGGVGLNGSSLSIQRGSRNALLRMNGSGKTRLFQHTNGLLRRQSGVLRYAGEPVEYGRGGLRDLRSRVGMVFQNPDRQLFLPSVQEDVSFGPFNLGLGTEVVRQRVDAALHSGYGKVRRQGRAQPEFRSEKTRLHRWRTGHRA